MSLQFPSILPGTVIIRHAGKRSKNETEIEDKAISSFCSLKLYLNWKEDIAYVVNRVAVFIYNCVIWYLCIQMHFAKGNAGKKYLPL